LSKRSIQGTAGKRQTKECGRSRGQAAVRICFPRGLVPGASSGRLIGERHAVSDLLLSAYRYLPTPLRSVAASLHGLSLRRWRYGPETERLVTEVLSRECWNAEQWKFWQEERLAYILHRAATRVPYYREQWAARRRRGDRASWERLENWPILEKEAIRENPEALVADDLNVKRTFHLCTSGTTGKPLSLFQSQEVVRAWYALFEARCHRWHGLSQRDRWATLGGKLVIPVARRRPPFWVWNAALNQLYMSSYHLAPDLIPYYLDALESYEIEYVEGYTSSLYALAVEALRLGRRHLEISVAITNAEPVFDYQREAISKAFNCVVRETYGMAEAVAAASECEAGRLHVWPEAGWIEVREDDRSLTRGVVGDLVCTGLVNVAMLLVRYRVGDRGALVAADTTCSCGRSLPILAPVEGRVDDVLYTADGRCIGRLDPVFKTNLPVREAQIIQEAMDRVRVLYVPASDFTSEAGRSIVERLQARMGPVSVVLEEVAEMPRGANGKFRAVISRVAPATPRR
jgi:phenylacetate-CoA ligase